MKGAAPSQDRHIQQLLFERTSTRGKTLSERALSAELTYSFKTWRTKLTNRIAHRTIRLVPAMLVTIGLVAFLLFLTASSALGQAGGGGQAQNPTPSATASPAPGDGSDADLMLIKVCTEDSESGEFTCVEQQLPRDQVVQEGATGQGCVSGECFSELEIKDLGNSITVGSNDPFSIRAFDLLSAYDYRLEVSVKSGGVRFSQSCASEGEFYIFNSGLLEYTRNFTAYGCTAGQSQIGIKLKRVDNNETLVDLTRNITVTAATTPEPTVTTTPEPTNTPTPEAGTITWDTDLEPEQDGHEYGYEEDEFGDIGDDDFRLDGRNYDITHLKWDDTADEVEFGLDKCLKPSELVSLRIGTRTYTRTSYVRYNDSECGNRSLDQEFEFDENSNPLEVDDDETLEYEIELTLHPTAPAPTGVSASPGTESVDVSWNSVADASAYKLERREGTSGSWTVESSAISGTRHTVSSLDCTKTYYFRVSAKGDGDPYSTTFGDASSAVSASPNCAPKASISVSDDSPDKGDSVRLTVNVTNAPRGVTPSYSWQEKAGSTWSNLSSQTTTTYSAVSNEAAVRTFRVTVTYGNVLVSAEVDVVWEEDEIVYGLVKALEDDLAAETSYKTAETGLLSCVNGGGGASGTSAAPSPSFSGIDDLFNRGYTGSNKQTVDNCDKTHKYFNAVQAAVQQSITDVRGTKDLYDRWFETEQGQTYKADAGKPSLVKKNMKYLADNYGASGMASGAVSGSTGLDCVPETAPITNIGKLRVLDCLIFDTPHSFWRNSGDSSTLRSKIGGDETRYNWMGSGDWECTSWFDLAMPSCKKHDVAYGTLQMIVDPSDNDDTNTLDETWNPRNKSLADRKGKADIKTHGCQDVNFELPVLLVAASNAFNLPAMCANKSSLSETYYAGFGRLNHKGWPVSQQDVADGSLSNNPEFIVCVSPQLPQLTNPRATKSGATRTLHWTITEGCVVKVEHLRLTVAPPSVVPGTSLQQTVDNLSDTTVCEEQSTSGTFNCSVVLTGWTVPQQAKVELQTKDSEEVGPRHYSKQEVNVP